MARPGALQFLRKGVILVGAVFPRFVDTWNWLVGAFDSMCGDGDLNGQNGYVTVDRTNEDRPIIRLMLNKLNDIFLRRQDLPWSFRASGWHNGQMQIGFDCNWFGDYGIDSTVKGEHRITGCDQYADGNYYVEVNLRSGTSAELKRVGVSEGIPPNDFANDKYRIYIGKVEDGVQTDGIYCVPVVYTYL